MTKPHKRNPYARDLEDDKYRQRIKEGKRKSPTRPKHKHLILEWEEDDEPEAE